MNLTERTIEPTPRLTLCLAMDLRASTATGLKLSTRKLDRLNLALVDQLNPHLRSVQLDHTLVKFTGDGWLVMSDEQDDAARLSCLALIMANCFQADICEATGLDPASIPAMRLAVCWGRDLPVTMHGGARDFVGNSARHATRACQLCRDNEVLIDETVRSWISNDFATDWCDFEERLSEFPKAKMEETLVLHTLQELKIESADELDAPIYFVNTLSILGRAKEAGSLANLISEHLVTEAVALKMTQEELLSRWNELLSSDLEYDTVLAMLADLKGSGLKADAETYNALIRKSEDFGAQSKWLEMMAVEKIHPNIDTFNILMEQAATLEEIEQRLAEMSRFGVLPDILTLRYLIERAPDYATALRYSEQIAKLGVKFDADVYDALVRKAEDFETARLWLEISIREGNEPSDGVFIAVFSKGITHISADNLLAWYLGLSYHPAHPIKRAIAQYRRAGKIEDSLRLALDYPQTDTALKTIRMNPEKALAYFRAVVDYDPNHANGTYALGMALLEMAKHDEAAIWLQKAYELATPGTRKDELARYLHLFDKVLVGK